MPKIINSLKERIKEEATILFCEFGFDNVDMKRIAKACSIAVGTLYNYYPNKKQLYISIVTESWENTFKKMELGLVEGNDTESNLRAICKILYEDIIDRQGIGADVASVGKNGKNEFLEVKESFTQNIAKMLNKLCLNDKYKSCEDIQNKIANILLATIVILISMDRENKDENLEVAVGSIKEYYI